MESHYYRYCFIPLNVTFFISLCLVALTLRTSFNNNKEKCVLHFDIKICVFLRKQNNNTSNLLLTYFKKIQIVLPGDRKVEEIYTKDKPPSLEEQLADVQAHIEDLHVRTSYSYILHIIFWITHPISKQLGALSKKEQKMFKKQLIYLPRL